MRVLRDNRESVIAVLEAFVHDPLVNWRLVAGARQVETSIKTEGEKIPAGTKRPKADEAHFMDGKFLFLFFFTIYYLIFSTNLTFSTFSGEIVEQINTRALAVVARVQQKLTGKFSYVRSPF